MEQPRQALKQPRAEPKRSRLWLCDYQGNRCSQLTSQLTSLGDFAWWIDLVCETPVGESQEMYTCTA